MRPRPKPLQTSVHLPHRPHWTQVSVRLCHNIIRQEVASSLIDVRLQVCVRSWLCWRRLQRRLQRLRGPPLPERRSLRR